MGYLVRKTWIRRKVQTGKKLGRTIGFPTLNFHVANFSRFYKESVYSCQVNIAGIFYQGALHFGPKLGGQKNVLEMHVIGFNEMIYGQFVHFRIIKRIRNIKKFANLELLKKQILADISLCF